MESIADSNPMVSTALNSYSAYHRSPELRIIAEGHERFIRDAQAYAETNREEGREEGKAEGLAEGLAKGKAEGLAEGLAKGVAKVAVKMLNAGQKIDYISAMTGLSAEEIEKIAADNR